MTDHDKAVLLADKLRNIVYFAGSTITCTILAEDILRKCSGQELDFYYYRIIVREN